MPIPAPATTLHRGNTGVFRAQRTDCSCLAAWEREAEHAGCRAGCDRNDDDDHDGYDDRMSHDVRMRGFARRSEVGTVIRLIEERLHRLGAEEIELARAASR